MGTKVIGGVDSHRTKASKATPKAHGTSVAGAAAGNGTYKGTAQTQSLSASRFTRKLTVAAEMSVATSSKAVEQAVTMKCTVVIFHWDQPALHLVKKKAPIPTEMLLQPVWLSVLLPETMAQGQIRLVTRFRRQAQSLL